MIADEIIVKQSGWYSISIISITGHGDIAQYTHPFKAGAFDFLTKPINEQALTDSLQTAIKSGIEMHRPSKITANLQQKLDFGKINSDTAQGSVMLSHDISDNKIYVSWRKSNGDWFRDEVTGYTNFYQTNIRFAFDEHFMQTITMHRFRQMDMSFRLNVIEAITA